jgi:hypothetical protein
LLLLLLLCTGGNRMDLSRHTTDKLWMAMVLMVQVLGGINTATLLLPTPILTANKAKEKDGMGGEGGAS